MSRKHLKKSILCILCAALSSSAWAAAPTVANPVPDQTWSGSGTKSFQVPASTFVDGDGDTLTYSATQASGAALPSWLHFDAGTRTFSGNPVAGAIPRSLKVMVRDGHGGSASLVFNLNISKANDPPTVTTPIADQTWSGSGTKSFQVPSNTFADVDRDRLTYSARLSNGSALPSWLRFSATTRTFSGTPPAGTAPLDVRVTATDRHGRTVRDTFRLTVSGSNHAPVAMTDTLTVMGSQAVTDTLTATDSDGNSLTYSIVSNGTKGQATFTNAATGAVTYTPNSGATGTDSFTFKVNDGQADSNTATVTVTITNLNDAPVASAGTLGITGSATGTGTLGATDGDGDALTYTLISNGSKGTVIITNSATGTYSYTPNSGATGTDTFTFKVNDGQVDSNTATVTVTIVESTDLTNSLGMTFKRIPAGTFTMGSPSSEADRGSDEVQHQVTISQAFYMQTTEITQGQWRAVMGSNPSYFSSCGDDCPVEQVSWNDLQNFILYLNEMGQGTYRLPTEAEWEYAARAGTTTAYSFGSNPNNLGSYGWYLSNASSTTHPVAQKLPNPWGLYDMYGNVWEWVQDWYGSFTSSAVTDPQGASSGSDRVVRGGSWYRDPVSLRSANRDYGDPGNRGLGIGARVLRTAP